MFHVKHPFFKISRGIHPKSQYFCKRVNVSRETLTPTEKMKMALLAGNWLSPAKAQLYFTNARQDLQALDRKIG